MSFLAAVLFTASFSSHAALPECEGKVFAYNEYEDKENGHIVEKHSVFAPTEWSSASEYEGLLIKSGEAVDSIEIAYSKEPGAKVRGKQSSGFSKWNKDGTYLKAEKLDPKKLLDNKDGVYVIRLLKNSKPICETTLEVSAAD